MPNVPRRLAACLAAVLAVCLCGRAAADDAQALEYKVKAAYLYNFVKFVEWPPGALADSLNICILGQDPFGAVLDPLEGQKIKERTLSFKRGLASAQGADCQVAFVCASENARLAELLPDLHRANVLTVSDIPGFARHGGIIGFIMREGKVRMEVNLEAMRETDVLISAKLLEMASIVEIE